MPPIYLLTLMAHNVPLAIKISHFTISRFPLPNLQLFPSRNPDRRFHEWSNSPSWLGSTTLSLLGFNLLGISVVSPLHLLKIWRLMGYRESSSENSNRSFFLDYFYEMNLVSFMKTGSPTRKLTTLAWMLHGTNSLFFSLMITLRPYTSWSFLNSKSFREPCTHSLR